MRDSIKMLLTDQNILTFPLDTNREVMVWDTAQQYLALRITPKGSRSWYFYRQFQGENFKLKLGEWPELHIDQARDIVSRILIASKMGINPRRFLQQMVWSTCTFKDVFEQYLQNHLKVYAVPKTAKDVESTYQTYFARLLQMPATQITSRDVQGWIKETAETYGKATASKQFTFLKAALRWADTHGIIELKHMPTSGLRRPFPDVERERYIRPSEYEALEKALEAVPNQDHADIIRILLFTGVRKRIALEMRWEHIDWDAKLWRVPNSTTNKKTPVVALTGAAIEVLTRRKSDLEKSGWVFPSVSASGHIEDITKTWYAVRKLAGLGKDVVLHTLRHTAGSMLGQTNASSFVIMRALGHSSSRMSERYTKLAVEPVRESMELAQSYLMRREKKDALPPNVIALKPRMEELAEEDDTPPQERVHYKNAEKRLTGIEQTIVEGKILTAIRAKACTKKAFYSKIGTQFQVNSAEMERVLKKMEAKGLIRSFREAPNWHVVKYSLCDEVSLPGYNVQANESPEAAVHAH